MEHIGKVLGSLPRGMATQNPKITEPRKRGLPASEEDREWLRQALSISSLDNSFENFKRVKGTEKALAAFKVLAGGRTHRKLLLCYGGVGNGKTHLCEASAIKLYQRGIFCRVLTMARIMRILKSCIGPEPAHGFNEVLQNYCFSRHLIIDDVGMGGSGSEWEFGQLEEIIQFRYRERLFTVMTTNRDLTELPERIVSRFQDPDVGTVVLNEGADYRRLKGRE